MNSVIIDIVFVLFFMFMALFGFIKGFITRLYDFIGTIIACFVSYWLSKPISSIVILYSYDQSDLLSQMFGKMINQVLVFFVLLVILFIVKKLIGLIIKPILKGISDQFAFSSFADHCLGIVLSIVEGIIIAYLLVVFLITPVYPQGRELIDQTHIAKHILDIVPSITNEIQNMNSTYDELANSSVSTDYLVKLMLTSYNLGIIDEEQFLKIYTENIEQYLKENQITLTADQKEQFISLISKLNQKEMKNIINNISVSDE